MSLAYVIDAILGVVCLIMVGRRYRGHSVRLIPGDMVLWTFTLFFILPLFLDATDYVAVYRTYPELQTVSSVPEVHIISALTVLVGTFLIARTVRRMSVISVEPMVIRHRWVWFLIALCPLAVVALAPDPGVYSHMAAVISQSGPGEPSLRHVYKPVPNCAISCVRHVVDTGLNRGLSVWFMSRHRNAALWMVLPIGFMDFWINGKRNIIALLLIQFAFVIGRNLSVDRRSLRRYVAIGTLLLLVLVALSSWFQNQYRATVVANSSGESFKIDFGRTDVVHLAVAGQLGYAPRPLSYPGQSLVLYVDAVAARVMGGQKDVTYPDRVTSIAKSRPIESTPGSIITTSIVSEAIDNFGWFGIFIGPVVLVLLIRWSARVRDPILGLLIALLATLLIVTEILAAVPLIAFVVVRAVWIRRTTHRPRPESRKHEPKY